MFFGEQRVHYDFVDIEESAEGLAFVEEANNGKHVIPVLLFEDGSTLIEPSNAELAQKLGIDTRARRAFYDLIIVGSGSAGSTAALYAAREGIETLVIERGGVAGQAGITERLDNFPGFPEGISGGEFADRLRQQAERGFVITDGMLQTSVPGLFAAGDCREGSTKQAASAAGEGAAAALSIRRYLQPLTSGMPEHARMIEQPDASRPPSTADTPRGGTGGGRA